jgi:hypothetical protein
MYSVRNRAAENRKLQHIRKKESSRIQRLTCNQRAMESSDTPVIRAKWLRFPPANSSIERPRLSLKYTLEGLSGNPGAKANSSPTALATLNSASQDALSALWPDDNGLPSQPRQR